MTDPAGGALLAVARCPECGLVIYPQTVGACPRCRTAPLERTESSGDGIVWSWTVQRYAPKSPPFAPPAGDYEPFVVAYVETAEGFRVEGILDGGDAHDVGIGRAVRLVRVEGDVPRFALAAGTGEGA